MPGECPPRIKLCDLQAKKLPEDDRLRVEAHVGDCASCQDILRDLAISDPTEPYPLPPMLGGDADHEFIEGLKKNPPPEFRGNRQSSDSNVTTSDADDWPTDLERYRIVRKLAQGGMGVVLLARDGKFDRSVAIKILSGRLKKQEKWVRRFLDETQLMGRLQHPGIPSVHDHGKLPDGRPYLAMKLIKGETVSELLDKCKKAASTTKTEAISPVNLTYFVNVFEKICHTIAYAHSRGVIHCDLKPGNVMVGAFGEVQVMDWGIAKALRTPDSANNAGKFSEEPETNIGELAQLDSGQANSQDAGVGTLGYMPPEQARGEVLDERCDVFELGAILCEILTGEPPFNDPIKSERHQKTCAGDLSQAYARLDACGADPQLVLLAMRCLAPQPPGRLRDAGAVADAVMKYQSDVQQRLKQAEIDQAAAQVKAEEETKRRKNSRRWAALLVFFVMLASVAGIAFYLDRQRSEQEERAKNVWKEVAHVLGIEETEAGELQKKLASYQLAHGLMSRPDWELEKRQEIFKQIHHRLKDRVRPEPKLTKAVADQEEQLDDDAEQLRRVNELDAIQLEAYLFVDYDDVILARKAQALLAANAARKYAGFFLRRYGVSIEPPANPATIAATIREEKKIRHFLIAALDHWAELTQHFDNKDDRQLLLRIAREADDREPWRDRFRQPEIWNDKGRKLELLQHDLDYAAQSPQILRSFAAQLKRVNRNHEAVLQSALTHYPDNFWLNLAMAKSKLTSRSDSQKDDEPTRPKVLGPPDQKVVTQAAVAAGHLRAALALRPGNQVAWNNLGAALLRQRINSDAIVAYKNAITGTAKHWNPHQQIGKILLETGKFDLAKSATDEAKQLMISDNWPIKDLEWQIKLCQNAVEVMAKEKAQAFENAPPLDIEGQLTKLDPRDPLYLSDASWRKSYRVQLRGDTSYQVDLERTDRFIRMTIFATQTHTRHPKTLSTHVSSLLPQAMESFDSS
jgi:serine/threonine protein kinase